MLLCLLFSVQCFLLWYLVEFMHVALSVVFCVVFSPLVFSRVHACCSVFCFLCSVLWATFLTFYSFILNNICFCLRPRLLITPMVYSNFSYEFLQII